MHALVDLVKPREVMLPCEHPVVVKQGKRKVAVACGKCPLCLQKKADIWRFRLKQECADNKYCLFFTLTYDNDHVPIFGLNEDASYLTALGEKGIFNEETCKYEYSEKRSVPVTASDFPLPLPTNFDMLDVVSVVSRSDCQKFMKRFRYYLKSLLLRHYRLKFYDKLFSYTRWLGYNPKSQDFKSWLDDLDEETYDLYFDIYKHYRKIYEKEKKQANQVTRYFICSEYTPGTFRPHFHGLLWFDDDKAYQFAKRCVYKAWTLCAPINIDCQPVSGDAYSYVAKYVTGNTNLPAILQAKSTRTFCMASKAPAIGYKSFGSEKVLEMYLGRNIFRRQESISADGKQAVVSVVPESVVRRFFPKCFECSSLSYVDKLRVYSRFVVCRKTATGKRIDVAASLRLFDETKRKFRLYPEKKLDMFGDEYSDSSECFLKAADLNAARRCLQWCIKYDTIPEQYMDMLDWFDYEYNMFYLRQQYDFQQRYAHEVYVPVLGGSFTSYDRLIGLDYSFLASVPFYAVDAAYDEEFKSICLSFGIDWHIFYMDHLKFTGVLNRNYLDVLYEYNQPEFDSYRKKVTDKIKTGNKSKEANSKIIDSLL